MTLVEKIKAWIDNFVNNIKKAFEGVSAGTDTSDFLTYLNTAGEIEAYDVGDRVNYTTEQRKNTRPDIDRTDVVFADSGVSYSIENDNTYNEYANVIDSIEKSDDISNKGNFIEVSSQTPTIIVEKTKSENLPMAMSFETAYLETRHDGKLFGHYHNLGSENMKKLPKMLENPEYIITLENGRINVILDMETQKGKRSLVSIELSQAKQINGKFTKYNLIITEFGAKEQYLKKIIENPNNIINYNKETKTQGTDRLYKWSDGINASISIESISNPNENVKENKNPSVTTTLLPAHKH